MNVSTVPSSSDSPLIQKSPTTQEIRASCKQDSGGKRGELCIPVVLKLSPAQDHGGWESTAPDPPARPAPAFLSQEAWAGAEILYPTHLPDDAAGAGPGTAPGEPLVSPRSKDLGVEQGAPESLHTASLQL